MNVKKAAQNSIYVVLIFFVASFFSIQSLWAAAEAEEGLTGRAGRSDVAKWYDEFRDQLHGKKLDVAPRYRQEYDLDSNIFLTPTDPIMDSIFRELPGIAIMAKPYKQHTIKIDYEAELEQFVKNPSQNDENQYFTSAIDLKFNKFYVHTGDNVTHTSSRAGTTFTERIPRFENLAFVQSGYKWNRFTVEGLYENFYRKFNTTAQRPFDYTSNKFAPRLYLELTPKVNVFFEYAYTDYDYRHNGTRSAQQNAFYGGVRGDLLPKTSLYAKFGFANISYSGPNIKDDNNFVSEIGVLWKPLSKTKVDFGWLRSQEQATFANTDVFLQNLIFFRLNQELTRKLVSQTNLYYTNQDYEQSNTFGALGFLGRRDDNLFTANTKLIYTFTDWFSADIKYAYNRRDADPGIFSYTDHVMTVGAKIQI